MNWKEAGLSIALAAALLVVMTGVARAQLFTSLKVMDKKCLGDIYMEVQLIAVDNNKRKKVGALKDNAGRAFWSDAFKQKLLDEHVLRKLASSGSACGDSPSDGKWLEEENGKLEQCHCSFTSPKAASLLSCMSLRGGKRAVLFTFDSRNWGNYGKSGVPVIWSDGDSAEFMSAKAGIETWGLTEDQWKDPAGKIIGVAKPFDKTFQEAECAAYAAPNGAKPDSTDYCTVYRKLGRTWTIQVVEKRDGKEVKRQVRYTVKEVNAEEAMVLAEEIDASGKPIAGRSKENTVDLSDSSIGRPPQSKKTEDAESEIEAAGKKWKVRKWVQFDGKFTYWLSSEIPGLIIKGEQSGGTTIALTEFKEGQ